MFAIYRDELRKIKVLVCNTCNRVQCISFSKSEDTCESKNTETHHLRLFYKVNAYVFFFFF